MKPRALILLSGGLDSMLSGRLLIEQGIDITAICFASNFYGTLKARKTAETLGVKLLEVDIKQEILDIVKNPPSGFGKNMNPCIDCHALMFGHAGKLDYDFIATGEVMGQRPFSQTKSSLFRVQKLAGLPVLRPLSAKLLPETEMEKSGMVDRSKLEDFSGRSRERQFALAAKFGITDYPTPAGGCLLTDPGFSDRLRVMVERWPECTIEDIELLKNGRIYWFSKDNEQSQSNQPLIVVGREKADNDNLTKLARKGDFMLESKEGVGPTTIIRFKSEVAVDNSEIKVEIPKDKTAMDAVKEADIIKYAAILTGYYSKRNRGKEIVVLIHNK